MDELTTPLVNRPVTEARSPESRAAETSTAASASTRPLDLPPRLAADASLLAAGASSHATGSNAVAAGASSHATGSNAVVAAAGSHATGSNAVVAGAGLEAAAANLVGLGVSLVADDGPSLSNGAEERRRHPRALVELLVGLKFASVQHFLAMYAEDISESGMFLRSEHAGALRSIGEELELSFDAGNRRIVQGRGRVVRVIGPGDPTSISGIAIEFVELDETSRKLVEAIVRIKLASVRPG